MTTFDAHKNFAYSTVLTPPSPASSGLSLTVAASGGALFPAPPFNCTVCPAGSQPLSSNAEIVRVTGIAGDVFTIVRAQEGSSARAIGAGDQIANTETVKVFTDIEAFLNGWTNDSGNPAALDSHGGALTVGKLIAQAPTNDLTAIFKRHSVTQSFAQNIVELQDESGNKLWTIGKYGRLTLEPASPFSDPDGQSIGSWTVAAAISRDNNPAADFSGNGIGYFSLSSSLYAQVGLPWQASHTYTVQSLELAVVIPTAPNGHSYIATSSGVSGSSEPVWPTDGSSVGDGTMTWQDIGVISSAPYQFYGPHSNDGSITPRVSVLLIWRKNSDSQAAWGIGSSGEEQLWVTTAPADADVATSQRAQYYDDAVGSPKLWIKQRDAAGTLFLKIAAALNSDGALDMHSHLINNVTDPVSAQDAATKNYVDGKVPSVGFAMVGLG